eukprot:scaffold5382_cov114-Isochrysis_galbana.AAC.10
MSGPAATRGIHLGRSLSRAVRLHRVRPRQPRAAYPSLRTFALLRQNFPRIFRGPLRNEPAQAGPEAILVPSTTPVQGGTGIGTGMQGGHPVTRCPPSLPPIRLISRSRTAFPTFPRRLGSTARLTQTTRQTMKLKWMPSSTASHPSLSPPAHRGR